MLRETGANLVVLADAAVCDALGNAHEADAVKKGLKEERMIYFNLQVEKERRRRWSQ